MKKVLILTVTAGNGHNACARAMKAELEKTDGVEVRIVDLIKEFSTRLNAWICDRGYALAVAKLPKVYNYFYEKYKNADPENRYSCPAQGVACSVLKGLLGYICTFQPDVIYCTHFYASIALTDLKLVYKLPCKCITANLDYVNSPFWEAGTGVDYLALPNEDFIDEFLFEGYERARLLPIGLPVDGRTLETTEKARARERLGLEADAFTPVIIFGGGMWKGGFRLFKSVLGALEGKHAQIVVINGRDKRGYKKIERLRKKCRTRILNAGFTDNVPLYLACADFAVCKAGGTGATEIINAGLPMLVTKNLPAQETHNLDYLKTKGVALSFGGFAELENQINFLYENPDKLKGMAENTLPLRLNAVGELAKIILEQPTADYSGFGADIKELKRVKKRVKTALKYADLNERKRNF